MPTPTNFAIKNINKLRIKYPNCQYIKNLFFLNKGLVTDNGDIINLKKVSGIIIFAYSPATFQSSPKTNTIRSSTKKNNPAKNGIAINSNFF